MNSTNNPKQQRKFFLIVAFALLVLAAVKGYRLHWFGAKILGALGLSLLILEFALPKLARAFFTHWMKFAHILGRVNTAIVVTLIYAVVLTPVGWFRRAILKVGNSRDTEEFRKAQSSWCALENNFKRESYFHPY